MEKQERQTENSRAKKKDEKKSISHLSFYFIFTLLSFFSSIPFLLGPTFTAHLWWRCKFSLWLIPIERTNWEYLYVCSKSTMTTTTSQPTDRPPKQNNTEKSPSYFVTSEVSCCVEEWKSFLFSYIFLFSLREIPTHSTGSHIYPSKCHPHPSKIYIHIHANGKIIRKYFHFVW